MQVTLRTGLLASLLACSMAAACGGTVDTGTSMADGSTEAAGAPYIGFVSFGISSDFGIPARPTQGGVAGGFEIVTAITREIEAMGLSSCGLGGTTIGTCCIRIGPQQTFYGDSGAADALPPPPTAGTMSLFDGKALLGTVTQDKSSYEYNFTPALPAFLWKAGDTLAVSTTGGNVHRFTGTVMAVSAFGGVSPDLGVAQQIGRASDYVVRWAPDTVTPGASVALDLNSWTHGEIECDVPDSDGSLTVPSKLLSQLSAGTYGLALARYLNSSAGADNATVTIQSSVELLNDATLQ